MEKYFQNVDNEFLVYTIVVINSRNIYISLMKYPATSNGVSKIRIHPPQMEEFRIKT